MSDYKFLGPYRIETKLGQGGMGSVYRGVHEKTGQPVAIKVLSSQMSGEEKFRRRFADEIETLKRLKHPNIVRLIGHGEEGDALFFSMELVEGPSLLEHLRKVKRLDWDTTIGFAIEICSALKHAHDIGVIHRDLKPANLLIEPEGRIKLTDFGIAKLFGSNEHTAAGSVIGTADYMAPEQASAGAITPRTDLYALGSLMYACLVGRPPFGGRNLTQVLSGLKHEKPPAIDLVLPDLPPELVELIHELLEKSPEDRPPTALVVGKRLGALRAGLRRRGEQARLDQGGATLAETPPDTQDGNPQQTDTGRTNVRKRGAASDRATAADFDADAPTGFLPASMPTIAASATLPDEATGLEPSDSVVVEPVGNRSRFETVSDDPATSHRWSQSGASRGDRSQWLSIAGLGALLLTLVGITLWMVREPSAEELLKNVRLAEVAGDERARKNAIEDFLRLHPEDGRAEELRDSLPAVDASQLVEQLKRRLSRRGYRELTTAELSWLEAMEQRDQPELARQQLTSWLAVYNHPAADEILTTSDRLNRHRSIDELTKLAVAEVERLNEYPEPVEDPRAGQLRKWLDWGQANLTGQPREEFIQGAKLLYADKPWANGVLKAIE